MRVLQFATPLLASNMYLLTENSHGIVIDPYDGFAAQIAEECQEIDYILLTHEHYDHISGANALRERYGCPVVCSEACGRRIRNSAHNFSRYYEAYAAIQTGEPLPAGLPPVAECFTYADEVFSGDTLLGDVTVTRFPGGSGRQYKEIALPYLKKLPGETLVYPGHYKAFPLWEHKTKMEESYHDKH